MSTVRKILVVSVLAVFSHAGAQEGDSARAEETWLPSLITETPQQGFELAVTLARRGVATTQPDREVLEAGRQEYADDPDSLISASSVVAIHFQTIAAANDYWRTDDQDATN